MSTTFTISSSGCPSNLADFEQMAGLLQKAGFTWVETVEEAYVVLCNPEIKPKLDLLEQLQGQQLPNKIMIFSGCFSKKDPKLKNYSIISTQQIHGIVELVEEALNDNPIQLLDPEGFPPLNLPKIRRNPFIEILPISRGYHGNCIYCHTKQSRNYKSYPAAEIIAAARKAINEGVKEIFLQSANSFGYGLEIGTDLPMLLEQLTELPGEFRIKIGPGNPEDLIKTHGRLMQLYQHPKIFKILPFPILSGSNRILQMMKQKYAVSELNNLIKTFRTAVPQLNVVADFVVAHSGETDDDFWQTLENIRINGYDSINIRSSPVTRLPEEIVQRRTRILTDISKNTYNLQNENWLNWEGEVIIEEKVTEKLINSNSIENREFSNSLQQWIGRNDSYKPVMVEGNLKLGDIVKVKIIKAGRSGLFGKAI